MRQPQKHVITGGPGVGKTTTLELLAQRGYETVRETARDIISMQQEAGEHGILPWTDNVGFQYLVLDTLLRRERQATADHVFCDRGAFDAIAYCRIFCNDIPQPLWNLAKTRRYEKVFLLDQLPNYVTDKERRESPELANNIHRGISEVYQELGYEVIRVPVLAPEKRVDYIIERISDYYVKPTTHTTQRESTAA